MTFTDLNDFVKKTINPLIFFDYSGSSIAIDIAAKNSIPIRMSNYKIELPDSFLFAVQKSPHFCDW